MTPKHQTKYSAGADLSANETVVIKPNEIRLVGTGCFVPQIKSIDEDLVFMLCNRSSVAYKRGLIVANGIGVIDQDYCDEIKVMFINLSCESRVIQKGEKIAQLVPMRYVPGYFDVVKNDRVGGFGSTDESKAFNELLDRSKKDIEQGKTKNLNDFMDEL